MIRTVFVPLFFAVFCFSPVVAGQAPPGSAPENLTLAEAVRVALEKNPTVQAFLQALLIVLRFGLHFRTAAKKADGRFANCTMRIRCHGNHASLIRAFAQVRTGGRMQSRTARCRKCPREKAKVSGAYCGG